MILRELAIQNFRKFRDPVRLSGFTDGLNLVCEPNETGKSTLLEALRAALFERHGSRSERVRSFRPYGDEVAPTVELTFSVAGETWSLRKRFLQGAGVVLTGAGRRYESDEAEETLQSLLGFTRAGNRGADDDSRGALGLLWVEQGQSFVLSAPGQSARRTIEDVLVGEVGAVTGGRRTSAVLKSVEGALWDFLTPTGRPTRRLAEAQQRAAEAEAALTEARAELRKFEETLTRLEEKRGELRRVVRDLEDPEREAATARLRADLDRARLASEQVRTAHLKAQAARERHERAERRAEGRQAARAGLAVARQKLAEAERAVSDHASRLTEAKAAAAARVQALTEARDMAERAEAARDAVREGQQREQRARALGAAFDRLRQANGLARRIAEMELALSGNPMNGRALETLEGLERRVLETRAAFEAGAATLEIDLDPGASGITLDQTPVSGGQRMLIAARTELAITGVGRFAITPPGGGTAAAEAGFRSARADLDAFLAKAGHPDAALARRAARDRAAMEGELKAAQAQLQAICPADPALGIEAGVDALRSALAGRQPPEPEAIEPNADPGAMERTEAIYSEARTAEREADARRQAALEALQKAELISVSLAARVGEARQAVDRLSADLTQAEAEWPDDALEAEVHAAKAEEARTRIDLESARRAAEGLDPDAISARLANAERRKQNMVEERNSLREAIARLEEQAKMQGGAGPASNAEAAAEAAEAAREEADRLREEADVLTLLRNTIQEAQADASRKYLAPITRRVEPYVQRLLPNASLSFGEDLRPQLLTRGDRAESADDLSKGTQEQIAVLTRLAFADLLRERGKPASLVLDDTLVFSDDARFETMTEILAEAGKRMQVIVLTCRKSAFLHLEARRLSLHPA